MFGKRSFSILSLAMYILATSALTAIILNANSVTENAKVTKLIDEIVFYNDANKQFVINYSSLPGLVPYENCIQYTEFNGMCRNQDDINVTTSEYVYNRYTDGCNHAIGCFIKANGTAGQEDILRMFLLPMRYLKTARLIDTVNTGLDTKLDETENYSSKVWAKSKVDNNIYLNIYNYNNMDTDLTRAFLFSGQKIFRHIINSGTGYEHIHKLETKQNQYLLYIKNSTSPTGAVHATIAHKADVKIDDGKPFTGRFTTFSTSTFIDNFKNSEYAKCVTKQPIDENSLVSAEYNISKTNGYCNIAYQLDNVMQYVDIRNAINYGKPLKTSYNGLQKCTNYQNISMCEKAISKSGLTNRKITAGKGATNFASYTVKYPDGSVRTINISRRFTESGNTLGDMYIKNTITGKEIKATGGCWYNYTGHKRTACWGPITINGKAGGYYCCYANNINQLLQM